MSDAKRPPIGGIDRATDVRTDTDGTRASREDDLGGEFVDPPR